jgi:hypothetical protein
MRVSAFWLALCLGAAELRYSIGGSSASRQWFHDDAYCELIDLPTTTPILTAIFGGTDYLVGGAGGDCALPGAIEYQELHRDGIWAEPYDPQGKLNLMDYPVPIVTINFQMCDTDPTNGPIRQIPGTHHTHEPLPKMDEEPPWMKLSTVSPAPAGTGIFRDNRCWHGGTPNLSHYPRAIPNIEYFAPWHRSEYVARTMPYENWLKLSDHGKHLARLVKAPKGEVVLGAGFVSNNHQEREDFKEKQLAQLIKEGKRPADWQKLAMQGKYTLPKM